MGDAPSASGFVRHVPTTRYTDPDILNAECQLLRSHWSLAGMSSSLPQPGSYTTGQLHDERILLTRAGDGRVRAFRNVCQHRGVVLATGSGVADGITCPYHGWTYELDGRLRGVPRPDGFTAPQLRHRGLSELHAVEDSGLIWVSQEEPAQPLSDWLGEIPGRIAPYALGDMRPIQVADWIVPANWKVVLEQAIDFYHVPMVHRALVPHIAAEPVMTVLGMHSLQTLPIKTSSRSRRWLDAASSRGGPYTDAQRAQLQKFFVFPNLVLNLLPYHFTIMQFWPDGTNQARLHYRFCLRRGASLIEGARAHASWLASRWILHEDLRLLNRIQQGHAQSADLLQPLHSHERAVAHFHGNLSDQLGLR